MLHSNCSRCHAVVDLLNIGKLGAYHGINNELLCWNCFKEQKTKKLNIPNNF